MPTRSQIDQRLKIAYENLMARYPWQWWANIDFRPGMRFETVNKQVRVFLRDLGKGEHLQTVSIYFVCLRQGDRHYHVHVPIYGRNKDGKTLADVSMRKWERKSRLNPQIQEVYNLTGLATYHGMQFLYFKNSYTKMEAYNRRLLLRDGPQDSVILDLLDVPREAVTEPQHIVGSEEHAAQMNLRLAMREEWQAMIEQEEGFSFPE